MKKFEFLRTYQLRGGDITWDEGVCLYEFEKYIRITERNNMFGLVGDDEILPPIYSSITFINQTKSIAWFQVVQKDKYGIIQCDLKESKFILDIEYDSIKEEIFNDDIDGNYLLVLTITHNDLHGIYKIAYNSNSSLQWYDKVQFICKNPFWPFFLVEKDGLKGIYNKYGDLCVPCLYDELKFVEESFLYLVKNKCVETYSFKTKEFISLKYDKIEFTPNGVKVYLGNQAGVFREGTEVCPPIYDDVEFGQGKDIIIRSKNMLGVVTANGSIIEPKFENLSYLSSGYYGFLQNNKWGVVNNKNKIISPKYDYIYATKYDVYGRIGREMYNISKEEEFIKTFLHDKSGGYENTDSPILEFDSRNIDLLAF